MPRRHDRDSTGSKNPVLTPCGRGTEPRPQRRVELTERDRWHQEPPPAPDLMAGPVLYVTEDWRDLKEIVAERFGRITLLARISRLRGDAVVEDYMVYRAGGARDSR